MRIQSIKPLRISTPDGPRFVQVETVARLCGVSVRTAQRWRQAGSVPPLARRLLLAHLAGRLLPDAWHGFRFDGDLLVLPDGAALTPGTLRAHAYNVALTRDVLRRRRGEMDQAPLPLE